MKLTKIQIQAIIRKLERAYQADRNARIKAALETYVPSDKAKKVVELRREQLRLAEKIEKLKEEMKDLLDKMDISMYMYPDPEVLEQTIRDRTLSCQYPYKFEKDLAMDDLTIESIAKEEFNADKFIKEYIERLKDE